MNSGAKSAFHRSRILDSAIDYAIVSMDLNGLVTSWNDGARRILGWTETEACGRTAEMIFTQEDRAIGVPEREMGTALKAGRSNDERWHVRRDGTRFWASGEMFPLLDETGQAIGLMKVMRDRTQKWLEEQRQLAILKLGKELSRPAAWHELAATAAESVGKSLSVSLTAYSTVVDGLLSIEGTWRDPRLTSPGSEVVLPEIDAVVAEGRATAISDTGMSTVSFGEGVEGRAFLHVPLLESGNVVAVISAVSVSPREWTAAEIDFVRDVAVRSRSALERRRAEAALAELAASLERQVESRLAERNRLWFSTTDLMATVDADFCVQELNPAWTKLLGWAPEGLLGRALQDLGAEECDRDRLNQAVALLAEQQPVTSLICALRAKDGTSRSVQFSMSPDVDRSYLVGRDVTAQVDIEERLMQSRKMDALGQLTGGISHDFNNLLTGIIGSLDLMRLRLDGGRFEGLDRFMKTAQAAAQRAAALTHRLLAFARHQPLDTKPVNVNDLVAGMEELLRRTLPEEIHLHFALHMSGWSAMADVHQLENAILNMAINARDAMPRGGDLTIATADCSVDSDFLSIGDEPKSGDFICISVTDTGTGMSPAVISRVFEPFFTTKAAGQGTGLGLSMIYGFARQTGGDVKLSSEEGVGTTVRLYLPRATQPGTVDRVEQDVAVERGHGESVFVVEDDPTVRVLLSAVLDELGYRRIEAPDGQTALPILRSDLHIDLLITDLGLPFVNGRQLAVVAREHRPDLKILFITGYADDELLQQAQADKNSWILVKPVGLSALSHTIHEALR